MKFTTTYHAVSKAWEQLDFYKFGYEFEGRPGIITAEFKWDEAEDKAFVRWREWFGGQQFGEIKFIWVSGWDKVELIEETGDIYGMKEELA